MAELNELLLSIILILGSLALIVLIFVLMKVSNSLQSMEEQVTALTAELKQLMQRLTTVSEQAQTLLADLNKQKSIVETSVARMRDMTDTVYNTFTMLYQEVAPTVETIASFAGSIRRGITTFMQTWKTGR